MRGEEMQRSPFRGNAWPEGTVTENKQKEQRVMPKLNSMDNMCDISDIWYTHSWLVSLLASQYNNTQYNKLS